VEPSCALSRRSQAQKVSGWIVLLAAATACGNVTSPSPSPDTGPHTGAPDAVLWIDRTSSVELRGLRLASAEALTFPSAVGSEVWSPDRERLLLEQQTGVFSIVTAEGETHAVDLVDTGSVAFAWSPDGGQAALATSDHLALTDSDGQHPVEISAEDIGAPTVDWSPDGSKVAYKLSQTVAVVDAATSHVVVAPSSDGLVYWAPSSDWFVTAAEGEARIFGADGTPAGTHTDAGVGPLVYGWASDGSQIALGTCGGDIIVLAPEATEAQTLAAMSCKAQWSPVESRLAFMDEGLAPPRLKVWSSADRSTRELRPLSDIWGWDWSPDGSMLALQKVDGSQSVLIDSHDGSEISTVPGRASWSPSGDTLILASNGELFTATSRGGTVRSLATGVSSWLWLPDGKHLFYTTDREIFAVRADGTERTKLAMSAPSANVWGWLAPQAPCNGCRARAP
jgi:WD40 repeat protein